MNRAALKSEIENVRLGMAINFIQKRIKRGQSRQQVLEHFHDPRLRFLSSVYHDYGKLIRGVLGESAPVCHDPLHCKVRGWHRLPSVAR